MERKAKVTFARTATPPSASQARDALSAARLRAVHPDYDGWPYLQTAVFALRPVFTEQVPLAGVDVHWRLYLNPSTFCALPVAKAAGLLMHELLHLLLRHFDTGPAILRARGLAASPLTSWVLNLAQDLVINQLLAHVPLPSPGMFIKDFPAFPRGETSATYFDLLWKDVSDATPPPGGWRCGSGATGSPEDWEVAAPDAAPADPATGRSAVQHGLSLESQLAIARQVADAVNRSGSAPGALRRWAEELLTPTVDWRVELLAQLRAGVAAAQGRKAGPRDRRPSRRSHLRPDIVTLAKRPVSVRVGLVIDSSGSMGAAGCRSPLEQAAAEARAIIRTVQSPTVVFSVDTAATKVVVRPGGQIALDGGGGTDMRIGYEALAAADVDVGVVLTDGYTPWPDTAPDTYTALTVLVGRDVGDAPDWADRAPHKVLRAGKDAG